jgi:Cys-rich protein (TIGR01571 family)
MVDIFHDNSSHANLCSTFSFVCVKKQAPTLFQQEQQQQQQPIMEKSSSAVARTSIPVGQWRDGLWDIFRYGYCHCSAMNACCCVPIAAGQVITRLQLTILGRPGTISATTGVFRILWIVCLLVWTSRVLLLIIIALLDPNVNSVEWIEPSTTYYVFCGLDDILAYGYMAWTVLLLRNLRSQVRSQYAIPESDQCPTGCEDTCCSLVCPCFVAAQMMRHTADYDTYGGRCCTATGLPAHAPSIV